MRLKPVWTVLRAAAQEWVNDSAPRLGAALSYYTVFSIAPLFIIVIFLASLWFDESAVRAGLFDQVSALIGEKGSEAVEGLLTVATPRQQGRLASTIAIATLVVSATGLFIELQTALNTIWGVREKPGQGIRGFIRNRLLSFAMVIGSGFLLVVSLIVSAALAAAGKYVTGLMPGLTQFWAVTNGVVSFAVITVLFAGIFKVLPDVKIAWRDVWFGAGTTALLFAIGKFLVGFYLGRSTTVSAYGAAGSVVLILLWVYYSAQIMFFGAELTQVYTNRFGKRMQPKENAEWVSGTPKKLSKAAQG